MEKNMKNKTETVFIEYWKRKWKLLQGYTGGYIGIMEEKMEATIRLYKGLYGG